MPLGWVTCTYSRSCICKSSHLSLLNIKHTSKYAVQTTESVKQVWVAVSPRDNFIDLSSFHSPAPAPCRWTGTSLQEKQQRQREGRSLSNSAAVRHAAPCKFGCVSLAFFKHLPGTGNVPYTYRSWLFQNEMSNTSVMSLTNDWPDCMFWQEHHQPAVNFSLSLIPRKQRTAK